MEFFEFIRELKMNDYDPTEAFFVCFSKIRRKEKRLFVWSNLYPFNYVFLAFLTNQNLV